MWKYHGARSLVKKVFLFIFIMPKCIEHFIHRMWVNVSSGIPGGIEGVSVISKKDRFKDSFKILKTVFFVKLVLSG